MRAIFPFLAHRGGRAGAGRRSPPTGRVPTDDEQPSDDSRGEGLCTIGTVRRFLLVQIAMFLALVSIHFGLPIGGYHHQAAGATESVIAAVLVCGLLLTWSPRWSRRAAIAAQSFGTLGVLLGLFTIALGIGPRTILDLILNVVLLLTLMAGLAVTKRGAGHVEPVGMASSVK